jgi:hypothetical protein
VLVFRAGRVAAELAGADLTVARLLALSAGSAGAPGSAGAEREAA